MAVDSAREMASTAAKADFFLTFETPAGGAFWKIKWAFNSTRYFFSDRQSTGSLYNLFLSANKKPKNLDHVVVVLGRSLSLVNRSAESRRPPAHWRAHAGIPRLKRVSAHRPLQSDSRWDMLKTIPATELRVKFSFRQFVFLFWINLNLEIICRFVGWVDMECYHI